DDLADPLSDGCRCAMPAGHRHQCSHHTSIASKPVAAPLHSPCSTFTRDERPPRPGPRSLTRQFLSRHCGCGEAIPMDGPRTPLLAAEHVTKIYRAGELSVQALDALDLTVHAGELVAVMGPSGSGKTTLLNCLSGLDDIDGGRVFVGGRDLFAMSDADRTEHRARTMGFVFQSYNLIPVFTAAENVELPLLLVGTPARESRERALEMLD